MENDPFKLGHDDLQGVPRQCLVGVEGDPMVDLVSLGNVLFAVFPLRGCSSCSLSEDIVLKTNKECSIYFMAEGGYEETDPLMEHANDCDDDGDRTGPFQPGSVSTPTPGVRIPMRSNTTNRP